MKTGCTLSRDARAQLVAKDEDANLESGAEIRAVHFWFFLPFFFTG
jgi:hypothetical protein